jgi:hypothetical protein
MYNNIRPLHIGTGRCISYSIHDGGQSRRRRDRPPPSAVSCVCIVEGDVGWQGRERQRRRVIRDVSSACEAPDEGEDGGRVKMKACVKGDVRTMTSHDHVTVSRSGARRARASRPSPLSLSHHHPPLPPPPSYSPITVHYPPLSPPSSLPSRARRPSARVCAACWRAFSSSRLGTTTTRPLARGSLAEYVG